MDCVVPSYTPTLRALLDARARAAETPDLPGKMLAFAVPSARGLPNLPGAEEEVRAVERRYPGQTTVLPRYHQGTCTHGTRAELLRNLPQHAFLHFAGHGGQDTADMSSGVLDTYDRPTTIADLARLRLTDARLAFLSACETAVGATDVPDEAVHIAGALLIAGFTHVVGTSWLISDRLAVRVAKKFYDQMTHRDHAGTAWLDLAGSGRALHETIRQLRDQGYSARRWAPYVHIGP